MKLIVKGEGSVSLSQSDFVAQGGFGKVYAKGGIAYKVYFDPSKMISVGKIQELQAIKTPRIIKPLSLIVDKQDHAIGYTMKYVAGGLPLCQIFPIAYRKRNNIILTQIGELVKQSQDDLHSLHGEGYLVVDYNEMNFLGTPAWDTIYAIDPDSYQTPHFKDTALKESVKDWTAKAFTPNSDWFSFAVVSFQMWTGIHPYKGKYKGSKKELKERLPGDDPIDQWCITRRRMQAGVSVFHPDVTIPGGAHQPSVIPDEYRQWYREVLENGKRGAPPAIMVSAIILIQPIVRKIMGTDNLDIEELHDYKDSIRGVWSGFGNSVVVTTKGLYRDRAHSGATPKDFQGVAFSRTKNQPVVFSRTGNALSLYDITRRVEIPFTSSVDDLMFYDGRAYFKASDKVYEIILSDLGSQIIATTQVVANTLQHASKLYTGVLIQDLLGAAHVAIFPNAGQARQIRIPELDGYRIVDARYDRGVLMVVRVKGTQYDRLVVRFDQSFQKYDIREVLGITHTGLNFITLENGICVALAEEDRLEVFKAKKGHTTLKVIEDPMLTGDMILHTEGGKVLFTRGSKLYGMAMK